MVMFIMKVVAIMLVIIYLALLVMGDEGNAILFLAFSMILLLPIGIFDVAPDDAWRNRNKDYRDED